MTIEKAFDKFILKKKLKNLSSKTIENYECFVSPFLRFIGSENEVSCITTELVLDYVSLLYGRELSSATRGTYIRHIKAFLRWLKDCYNIPVALSEIEIPKTGKKLVHILTNEDIINLFSCIKCESEWMTKRNCAIIAFMLGSGLRQHEVVTLQWKNMYFKENYAIVRGKGDKERCVPLGSVVVGFLNEYKKICPFSSEYVFVGRRGGCITNNTIKQLVQKIKRTSGIDFSSHKLRHNFATNYCMDSLESTGHCDAFTLQVLLGHENVKTTEKYMHYASSMIASKNARNHLDSVFGV